MLRDELHGGIARDIEGLENESQLELARRLG